MMIGSPSATSTHPNSSASQSATPPVPPLAGGALVRAGLAAAAGISLAGGEDEHQHDEQSAPSHVLLHPVNFLHWCARVRSRACAGPAYQRCAASYRRPIGWRNSLRQCHRRVLPDASGGFSRRSWYPRPGRPAASLVCEPLPDEAYVEVHVRSARLTDLDAAVRILARRRRRGRRSATTPTTCVPCSSFPPRRSSSPRPSDAWSAWESSPSALGPVRSLRRHCRRAGNRAGTDAGRRRTASGSPTQIVEHLVTSAQK